MPVEPVDIELDEDQEKELVNQLDPALTAALEAHHARRERLADYRRAYRARPKVEVKSFPWPNASNVVIPLVAISVDAIVARFMKALLAAPDFCEVQIKRKEWEPLERGLRDWITSYVKTSGGRDRLRALFHDTALLGDGFVKPLWTEEVRQYHAYDPAGNVVEQNIPGFTGVKWHIVPADDVVAPTGFDEWDQFPWFALEYRHTWPELQKLGETGFYTNVDKLKPFLGLRPDTRVQVALENQQLSPTQSGGSNSPSDVAVVFELTGIFELPGPRDAETGEAGEPLYAECIICYHRESRTLLRRKYNPYFGKARHFVRVPFLMLPHEPFGIGIAEMSVPFQEELSTVHNQIIDAATAANAGIFITTPDSSLGKNPQIFPGKVVVTENPDKDVRVVHLSDASPVLHGMMQEILHMNEARTGVSVYNLGMESGIVGSRATATGTTALISQGNLRFGMSIDDIRAAIEELLYLTIQQEQQFRPEGLQLPDGTVVPLPPGDVRTGVGLKLALTSESFNKDIEIQTFQLLLQMLNEYYARFMQAAALIMNPAYPPQMKAAMIQVMTGAHSVMKRLVERFDVENIDEIVPHILSTIQAMIGSINGFGSLTPGGPPPGAGGQVQGGPGQMGPGAQPVGGNPADQASARGGQIPY